MRKNTEQARNYAPESAEMSQNRDGRVRPRRETLGWLLVVIRGTSCRDPADSCRAAAVCSRQACFVEKQSEIDHENRASARIAPDDCRARTHRRRESAGSNHFPIKRTMVEVAHSAGSWPGKPLAVLFLGEPARRHKVRR